MGSARLSLPWAPGASSSNPFNVMGHCLDGLKGHSPRGLAKGNKLIELTAAGGGVGKGRVAKPAEAELIRAHSLGPDSTLRAGCKHWPSLWASRQLPASL